MFARMPILCVSIILLLAENTKAQKIIATGVVKEKGTTIRIALAEITDIKSNLSVGSNDMGLFQIRAEVGDTLRIVKRHFKDQYIVVAAQDMIISLVRAEMILEEVKIIAENKRENLLAVREEHRKKTYFYGKKRNLLHYLRYPLASITELFGKERKHARGFDRYLEREEKELEIDKFFNLTLVRSNTKLRNQDLAEFMLQFRPKHEQIKNWNTYDAASYIKKSASIYQDILQRP